jgi:PAS domain S-box-containing protein
VGNKGSKRSDGGPEGADELRRRAEAWLFERKVKGSRKADEDPQRLLHQLRVHQVELEMQNEELETARHELESGLQRYTELFDFAPIGYLAISVGDQVIRELNLAAASLLGWERKYCLGRPFTWFVPADRRAKFVAFVEDVFSQREKRSQSCELSLITKKAELRQVHLSATTIESNTVLIAVEDITERKRVEALAAEQTLRERLFEATRLDLDAMTRLHGVSMRFLPEGSSLDAVFADIVDAAIAIANADFGSIQIYDQTSGRLTIAAQRGFPDWWVEFWNDGVRAGSSPAAFQRGQRIIVEDVEQSTILAGTPELEIKRKAGVRAAVATPLLDRSGKPIGLFSTYYKTPHRPDDRSLRFLDLLARQVADLVERANAEQAEGLLRRRFEVLDRISFSLGQRLAQKNVEPPDNFLQETVDQARAACDAEYAALGIGEDPTRPFLRWVFSGIDPALAKTIGRVPSPAGLLGEVIQTGRTIRLRDLTEHPKFRGLPPHHPPMRSFLGVVIPDHGRPVGHLYLANKRSADEFSHDDQETVEMLAERAGIAFEVARLARETREAVEARDNLLAVVSHDLRSPLSTIHLGAKLLTGHSHDSIRKQADMILRSAERMNRLIEDLLQAATIDTGTFTVQAHREQVLPLVEEVIQAHEPAAAAKSIRLHREVSEDVPPIHGDRGRIAQVLSNLIGNAIKFVPPGGNIRIRALPRTGYVHFAVCDDGPGIRDEDRGHLFDRYWKGKSEGEGQYGAGLGLYIAKGIVEAHNGRIWVESQPGSGSTFSFSIPIADSADQPAPVP